MSLPYFYTQQVAGDYSNIHLEEDTSRHITQVLRMQPGEELQLTDGKGNLHTAEIIQAHKKSTAVRILSSDQFAAPSRKIAIAISLIKNAARFEWFLEKAAEIGVSEIIPLICERTEKHHFRLDRMNGILVSAMLQSQQCWLQALSEPLNFSANIPHLHYSQKFIAHCMEGEKRSLQQLTNRHEDVCMLIGPEGDFSPQEIELALQHQFIPVSLGDTRLRTETAGIVAACLLKNLF